jgi:predicted PurR-regulated permease PerM
MTFSDIQNNIGQYLIGSFILAIVMSIIFGLLGFILLTIFSAFKNKNK